MVFVKVYESTLSPAMKAENTSNGVVAVVKFNQTLEDGYPYSIICENLT